MERIIEFTDEATALEFQAKLDSAHGYPRAGVPRPGGVHRSAGVTEHLVTVVKHPKDTLWAICVDDDLVATSVATEKLAADARIADGKPEPTDTEIATKTDVPCDKSAWLAQPPTATSK